MSEKKTAAEALLYAPENGCVRISAEEAARCAAYCEDYKRFLDDGKTERECAAEAVRLAEQAGFRAYVRGEALQPGDKIYRINRGKSVFLAVIGSEGLAHGVQIGGAHIDAPRLDLKPSPLYEDSELAYLKTHYYGGIRKYQWVAVPLELHGVVALKSGEVVEVCIGRDAGDPRLVIEDLLPHLGAEQSKKPLGEAIPAESLNILVGSRPLSDVEKDAVKVNVLSILHEKYGITEEDFISAELCAVPAYQATDIGLDRSMIGAYGQDDRVCAYAALRAILDIEQPKKKAVCLLVDKEEIGSVGATGMESRFFENTVAEVMNCAGQYSELAVRRALRNSYMLSSDVSAAFDPNYPSVMEKNNCAYFGKGLTFNKYTGSRGKSGSNDANAEYIAKIRGIFEEKGICYQTAELGKVDRGGGGTIAYILANYGMEVIDSGVAVQNMHAPYEVASKVDIYEAYLGYEAFLKEM